MVPLPYGDGEPVDPGEYLHAGADLFNERRSDENGFEGRLIRWIAVSAGNGHSSSGAVKLSICRPKAFRRTEAFKRPMRGCSG